MLERLPRLFEFTLEERPGSTTTITLYLVKGHAGQHDLLIDSGYGTPWCLDHLLAALNELHVEIPRLDVFLTHKHADHCGLAHELQVRGAHMYMNREEDRHQYDCLYYKLDHSNTEAQKRVLTRTGITKERAPLIWQKFMDFNDHLSEDHPVWMMTIDEFQYDTITPGQVFAYGDYRLTAIPLRGHSKGQMGLLESSKKLFFTADQLLNRTAPIVGTSHCDEHLLRDYFDSLNVLMSGYSDHMLLAAHEGVVQDICASAAHTIAAYNSKLELCRSYLSDQEQTVWEIAKQVYHLTPNERTDSYFYMSKMINTKTFSLLEYLYDAGEINRREENGMLFWSK